MSGKTEIHPGLALPLSPAAGPPFGRLPLSKLPNFAPPGKANLDSGLENFSKTLPPQAGMPHPATLWKVEGQQITFGAPTGALSAERLGPVAGVNARGIWMSPIFNLRRDILNTVYAPGAWPLKWNGETATVNVEVFLSAVTGDLRITALELGHVNNPMRIASLNARRDVTTTIANYAPGDPATINFVSTPMVWFWQLCLIFDNVGPGANPNARIDATAY